MIAFLPEAFKVDSDTYRVCITERDEILFYFNEIVLVSEDILQISIG